LARGSVYAQTERDGLVKLLASGIFDRHCVAKCEESDELRSQ
jgi:hypothetical protein